MGFILGILALLAGGVGISMIGGDHAIIQGLRAASALTERYWLLARSRVNRIAGWRIVALLWIAAAIQLIALIGVILTNGPIYFRDHLYAIIVTILCVGTEAMFGIWQLSGVPTYLRDADGQRRRHGRYRTDQAGFPVDAEGIRVPCELIPLDPQLAIRHPFAGQRIPVPQGRTIYPNTIVDEFGVQVLTANGFAIPHPYAGQAINPDAIRHFPQFVHNANLEPIGQHGQLIPSRIGAPIEPAAAVEDPEHDLLIIDEAEYDPNQLHVIGSLLLVAATFFVVGLAISASAIQSRDTLQDIWQHRQTYLIGMGLRYTGSIANIVYASVAAWVLTKSTDLLEAIATFAVNLPFIPETVRSGIRSTRTVNILEQELLARRIRAIAWGVLALQVEMDILLFDFPYPGTTLVVGAFLFTAIAESWLFTRAGGMLEVSRNQRRFYRTRYYILIPLSLLVIGWDLIPACETKTAVGTFGEALGAFFLRVLHSAIGVFSTECASVDPSKGYNACMIIVWLAVIWFAIRIANRITKAEFFGQMSELMQRWFGRALAAATLLAIVFSLSGIVGSAQALHANYTDRAEVCPVFSEKTARAAEPGTSSKDDSDDDAHWHAKTQ